MVQFKYEVAVIGCGKMGESILRSLLAGKSVKSDNIMVCEPYEPRREFIESQYKVNVTAVGREAMLNSRFIILAVKPNIVAAVASEVAGCLQKEQVILSIVAGFSLSRLSELFGHKQIVRAMPNLAAQIAQAATVWSANKELSAQQLEQARSILQAIGEEIYVDSERLIDVGTAISGSGPAYQYLFLEALTDAGVRLGLTRAQAERLAVGMARGSVNLAWETGKSLNELRYMVTTPGGTTAEAVYTLEKENFRVALIDAAQACYNKSQELGRC